MQKILRRAVKQNLIIDHVRGKIVSGALLPGKRLPTHKDLEQKFEASPVTIQSALDVLIRDGFIYANGSQGTFVTVNPPHLSRFGVVFPFRQNEGSWPRFWASLANQVAAVAQAPGRQLVIYYCGDGHSDSEDYQVLLRDVQAHRLAGLIFIKYPYPSLIGSPILEQSSLPRVALSPTPGPQGLQAVWIDRHSFIDKALDYLASKKCTRIASLSAALGSLDPEFEAYFAKGLVARGMKTRATWSQGLHIESAGCAGALTHLLVDRPAPHRPDGLVIMDDNLVENASSGLVAAGLRVPADIEVVAHCNFPWTAPSVLAVKRLGYEASAVLQLCLDKLEQEKKGIASSKTGMVKARFEDELLKG